MVFEYKKDLIFMTKNIHALKASLLACSLLLGLNAQANDSKIEIAKNHVRRIALRTRELSENTYYDVLDKIVMPIVCEWDEWKTTPLTRADAAKGGAALTALYGISKLKRKYQIATAVFTVCGVLGWRLYKKRTAQKTDVQTGETNESTQA